MQLNKKISLHDKNQPRQRVEDGYIFVDIFVKGKSDYLTNYFEDKILGRHIVTIVPTGKPEFCIKIL